MGTESFYLNVSFQDKNIDCIDKFIQSNKKYSDFINYHIDVESNELCLQAAIVSFFPICEMIYNLCKRINKESPIKNVNSRGMYSEFIFENSLEFFCWMYTNWKETLNYFHKEWGAFLINPTNYYKSRRKLRKKFYVPFSLDE